MFDIEYSGTLIFADKIRRLSSAGKEIVNFTSGTLIDTPKIIKEKTKQAIDDGLGASLTDSSGMFELKEAIAKFINSKENIYVDPNREIIVTIGAKNAIFIALQVIINLGDEILIPDPF